MMGMMDESNTLEHMGTHQMWGISPVFDLQETHADAVTDEGTEPLNILLAEPGDIRHVMRTLSARRRHSKRPLHFYIFEKHPEGLARDLLLLQTLHDWELPIRQRCNVWLEIYGNCLVQERTSKYIAQKGLELIQLLCNESGAMRDLVDLGLLKFKQRDELENVFKTWSESVPWDLTALRDQRLRKMYGQRYDVKKNLVDWDYRQGLKAAPDFGIVHTKQYREWRDSGVAFEFGDQAYTIGNRTMGSFAEGRAGVKASRTGGKRGLSKMVKGFWLDIVLSPYIGFGLDSERPNKHVEGLYQILDKDSGTERWRHNTAEVAVYNVLSWLHEIETGEQYRMTQDHAIYSGLGDDSAEPDDAAKLEAILMDDGSVSDAKKEGETIFDAGEAKVKTEQESALQRARCIVESMGDAKVFLLTGDLKDTLKKKKFAKKFNRVFLSSQAAHHFGEDNFKAVCASGCEVTVESARFVFALSEDQKAGYNKRVEEMSGEQGFSKCYDKLDAMANHHTFALQSE
jgi:dynein assembly factor 3